MTWQEMMLAFIIPLAVQWWASYYPGSEPGGGGYVVQRMLSAKDEKNAVSATLLFTATQYALRLGPWLLVALASLIVFPDLEALRTWFSLMPPNVVQNDMAYPAMLTLLPPGLLGRVDEGGVARGIRIPIRGRFGEGDSQPSHFRLRGDWIARRSVLRGPRC